MSHFLGQNLSDQWFTKGSPDPLRLRVWAALRYITMLAALAVILALMGSSSPGGAFLTGIGAGTAVSGLLNILFLPKQERSHAPDLALMTGGAAVTAFGIYLIISSS